MEPKPAILAVTAHACTEECQKMLDAGGDNFLAKPFRDRDLFDMLACHLSIQVNYAESAPLPESETSTRHPPQAPGRQPRLRRHPIPKTNSGEVKALRPGSPLRTSQLMPQDGDFSRDVFPCLLFEGVPE